MTAAEATVLAAASGAEAATVKAVIGAVEPAVEAVRNSFKYRCLFRASIIILAKN
jgi:hypothetical protein